MATIPTARAAYQHPTFSSNPMKEHPLTHEQRLALRAIRETIDRMENSTRNKAALILRLRTFNEQLSSFKASLNGKPNLS